MLQSMGHKESDTTEQLNSTELKIVLYSTDFSEIWVNKMETHV